MEASSLSEYMLVKPSLSDEDSHEVRREEISDMTLCVEAAHSDVDGRIDMTVTPSVTLSWEASRKEEDEERESLTNEIDGEGQYKFVNEENIT